ncbi:diguanylate cyclase [Hydrogenimonas sp.]
MKGAFSLTARIIALVTFSFLLLLSFVSYFHYHSMREFAKESEEQKSELILHSIAPVVSIDMFLEMDDPMIEYLTKIVQQNPMILKLEVRDQTGKTRFVHTVPDLSSRTTDPIVGHMKLHDRTNGAEIGDIEMLYSTEKYETLLQRYRLFTILLFIGSMTFATILLLWLRSYLSPLKKLADDLRSYDPKRHNFPKKRAENDDEISIIQNAIVDMVEKIENYTTTLYELNLQLETKVKERTSILEETNERLRKEVAERIRTEEALKNANRLLEHLSTKDALTNLYNRRMFDKTLKNYWKVARREYKPISLLLCDIDFFKRINDEHGHIAGDRCLQELAEILKECISRPMDMVARYGGEEFIFILPDTPMLGALSIANEIQKRMADRNAAVTTEIAFTLSIGIASVTPDENETYMDLLKAADQALYQAKKNGRNRIVVQPL